MPNTLGGVNLAVIAEESLPHLTTLFAPLNGIITDFSPDIASRGESVTTRYPVKPTAADLSSGYSASAVTATAITTTLDTFYGFVASFTDVERSKSSIMLDDLFFNPMVECLGDKIFGDIWNLIVASKFATKETIAAATFDRSDLADFNAALTSTKQAPKSGRTCWLNPTYYASLVKSLNSAEFPGATADKAEANVPRTAGFDIYESNLMDANSENLAGAVFHRSSLIMAGRRVLADDSVRAAGVEVEDVTVPGLGIPIQFRRWYDPTLGQLHVSVGLLYGVKEGRDFLIRITSA